MASPGPRRKATRSSLALSSQGAYRKLALGALSPEQTEIVKSGVHQTGDSFAPIAVVQIRLAKLPIRFSGGIRALENTWGDLSPHIADPVDSMIQIRLL